MSFLGSRVFGCSIDGFQDSIYVNGKCVYYQNDYQLADVILPKSQSDRFVFGSVAKKKSKVSSGLNWPPKAEVKPGGFIRRVPISYILRLMVEAGDKNLKWSVNDHYSVSLAKILVKHLDYRIQKITAVEKFEKKYDILILAIPNELDEFWQDEILRELKREGYFNIRLVWRPIAAALSWLDQTQNAFPTDNSDNDLMVVAHFGPDNIEIIPFRLRERLFNNKRYIIPLREPSQFVSSIAGVDWAGNIISEQLDLADSSAFWQIYTFFPDVWKTLAQIEHNDDELPITYIHQNRWKLWEPDRPKLKDEKWQTKANTCGLLNELMAHSTKQKRKYEEHTTWRMFLQSGLIQVLDTFSGNLKGLVLSGPLVSADPMPWLEGCLQDMKKKGLTGNFSTEAIIRSTLIRSDQNNWVAKGAAIYGQRINAGEPTYLDILPEMSLLVQKREELQWFSLAKDKEVEGGLLYKNNLKYSDTGFSLFSGSNSITVHLKKKNIFKKLNVEFPYPPKENIGLNTHIEMSPASGQAKVTFESASEAFLKGRRYLFDYSKMEDIADPIIEVEKKQRLGFPPVKSPVKVELFDSYIHSQKFQESVEDFFNEEVHQRVYSRVIGKIKNKIDTTIKEGDRTGKIIDVNGICSTKDGQALIDKIIKKLRNDFIELQNSEQRDKFFKEKFELIVRTSSRFYAGAPVEILNYLIQSLSIQGGNSEQNLIDPAGRILKKRDDIKTLFDAMLKRIAVPTGGLSFPIYFSRSLLRILEWRELGASAMTIEHAEEFVKNCLLRLNECIRKQNYKNVYFENIKLFLYLLRYREVDREFLSPTIQNTFTLFEEVKNILELAANHFSSLSKTALYHSEREGNLQKVDTIHKIQNGVEKYMNYEGSVDIIQILDEFIEEDE